MRMLLVEWAGLGKRMVPVPDRYALEGRGHAAERNPITSRKLQADRHTAPAKAPRQSHGRMTGEIERCRITLQLQDQPGLISEGVDFSERQGGRKAAPERAVRRYSGADVRNVRADPYAAAG